MSLDASSADAAAWVDGLLTLPHDVATLVLSSAGDVVAANAAAERLFGRPIVGSTVAALFAGPSSEKLERALRQSGCSACELQVSRPAGEPEAARFVILPVRSGERVLVSAAKHDARAEAVFATILSLNDELANLTRELSWRNSEVERARARAAQLLDAEREARERAEAAEAEARRLAAIQAQLAAVVGHDLRTPISAISMAAGLLKRRGVPEEQAALVERIVRSASRMDGIIRDLLDFSHARQGLGILVRSERTDVGELCRKVVHEQQGIRPDAQVEVRTEGDLEAAVDASRVSQAVANLVGNALQHGAGSGVDVTATGAAGEVVIVVHNGGPPIPPDLIPHLFEPFRQGPPPPGGPRPGGSVGLGLFIVREIVRSHHGTIEVQSHEATGTCFTVRLPRALAGPQEPRHDPDRRASASNVQEPGAAV